MKKSILVKKLDEIYQIIENLESDPVNMVCDNISRAQSRLGDLLDQIESDDFELDPETEVRNESE